MFSRNLSLLRINNLTLEEALSRGVNMFDSEDVVTFITYVVEMEREYAEKHYAYSHMTMALPIAEFYNV